MTTAIETTQLTRRYGRLDAVDGLDLQVPAGSVFALIGPNGPGKTTTIKLLMNLVRPSRGRSAVQGVDSRRLGVLCSSRVPSSCAIAGCPRRPRRTFTGTGLCCDRDSRKPRPSRSLPEVFFARMARWPNAGQWQLDDAWMKDAGLVVVRTVADGMLARTLTMNAIKLEGD